MSKQFSEVLTMKIHPKDVHKILSKYMLIDGFDLVLDLRKSRGCRIYDARSDRYLIDCFSFFATAPLGCNHPKMTDPTFIKEIGEIALHNPSNSDVYTVEMAEFVDTFARLAMPSYFHHLFFISGGALAVENALKTSFDWKIRKNFLKGARDEIGKQVIHFKDAFHGRTGYTLSMTNTFDPNKTKYFTKFNWPRITNPKITFPLNRENLERVKELERQAIDEIEEAVSKNKDDIAALIIEPIQGEGGDNHFRKEFFIELRRLCDKHEMMFIVDEVQSGLGLTGKMWAHEHYDIKPDILAFGKKTQVCGIMAGSRVDEIEDNVFKVSSRLNSTWGGNLVDMVRCKKYLEIMKEEDILKNVEKQGKYLMEGLEELQEKHSDKMMHARGKGLMCAFDLPTTAERDEFKDKLYKAGVVILGCGATTIRFRPPLIISSDEIDEVLQIIDKTLSSM
ncbi:MAG: L-lysine 6-transaminase [Candidatus Thermoplasmatota archaeon]